MEENIIEINKQHIIIPKKNFDTIVNALAMMPYANVCSIFPLLNDAKIHEKTEVDEAVLLELQQFNSFMNKFYDYLKAINCRIALNQNSNKYAVFEGIISTDTELNKEKMEKIKQVSTLEELNSLYTILNLVSTINDFMNINEKEEN